MNAHWGLSRIVQQALHSLKTQHSMLSYFIFFNATKISVSLFIINIVQEMVVWKSAIFPNIFVSENYQKVSLVLHTWSLSLVWSKYAQWGEYKRQPPSVLISIPGYVVTAFLDIN